MMILLSMGFGLQVFCCRVIESRVSTSRHPDEALDIDGWIGGDLWRCELLLTACSWWQNLPSNVPSYK